MSKKYDAASSRLYRHLYPRFLPVFVFYDAYLCPEPVFPRPSCTLTLEDCGEGAREA